MKKIIFSILALSLIAGSISGQKKIDIEKEKEAIIAVIEEETDAFRNRDFDRLAATFVQDETNIRLAAGQSGYSYYAGWEQISSGYKESFKNNPEPYTGKHVKTNYKIKIYKESAWSIFDEVRYDGGGEVINKGIGVRFLEKVDAEWKIVYLSGVSTSSYEEEE
jgi:hypothetical protein